MNINFSMLINCIIILYCYRLKLALRKGGKCIVQPKILMADVFVLLLHQNKTCVPEMPKAGNLDNC